MKSIANVAEEILGSADQLRVFRKTDQGDVLAIDVPGGEPAVVIWERFRAAVPETGYWPVMVGPPDDAEALSESAEGADLVAEILSEAEAVDMLVWFRQRAAEHERTMADFLEDGEMYEPPIGEWPPEDEIEPTDSFTTPFDMLTREPHARLTLALVPTPETWRVPAYLAIGGWNECPGSRIHCSAIRYWAEKYGAEIAVVTRDVVEMRIRKPPTTKEAALILAKEQYLFCNDIVEQGTESIARLAAGLLNGTAWFFWWD